MQETLWLRSDESSRIPSFRVFTLTLGLECLLTSHNVTLSRSFTCCRALSRAVANFKKFIWRVYFYQPLHHCKGVVTKNTVLVHISPWLVTVTSRDRRRAFCHYFLHHCQLLIDCCASKQSTYTYPQRLFINMSAEHEGEDALRQPAGSLGKCTSVPINIDILLTQHQPQARAQRSVYSQRMTTTTTRVSINLSHKSSLWQMTDEFWCSSIPRVAQLTSAKLQPSHSPRPERVRVPSREEQAPGRSRAHTRHIPRPAPAAHPPARGLQKEECHGHGAHRQARQRY